MAHRTAELRSSVRFPLKLAVDVKANERDVQAETKDISAGGVMLYVHADMAVGSKIDFDIAMPAAVLGTSTDVTVKCAGRVVRCSQEGDRKAVAAVIDEYRFDRG
jgi:ethanolamine utilization microcompartment shell protein EutL